MKTLQAHDDMYIIVNHKQIKYITRGKVYIIINCLFENDGWIITDDIGQQIVLMNNGFLKYFTVIN